MPDKFACLPQRHRWNPHGGQELAAEQQRQPLGVDAIILEASGGDGFGLLGVREDRAVPGRSSRSTSHHQVPEASMATGVSGGELREELSQAAPARWRVAADDFPVLGQDRDLRTAFVQVDATCTIAAASCLRERLRPTLGSQPSSAGQEANALMASRSSGARSPVTCRWSSQQVRAGHQSQDRQGARSDDSAVDLVRADEIIHP